MFRAAYSGDPVDQYGLTNTPVILVATGGSERHALVLEHELRPLFGFFQAATLPVGFSASSGDFDGTTVLNAEVRSRIRVGLQDVAARLRSVAETDADPADGARGEVLRSA